MGARLAELPGDGPVDAQTGFQAHEDAMLDRYASESKLYRGAIGKLSPSRMSDRLVRRVMKL
jgi:hypothetical protein